MFGKNEAQVEGQPKKPSKKRKVIAYGATAIGGIIIGAAMGAGPEDEAVADTTEEPTATETVTATPEPEVEEVEVEVETEVVPESCTNALASAETSFDIYSEALLLSADSMNAAMEMDIATLESITVQIEDLTVDLEDELMSYYVSASSCESAQ